MKKIEFIPSSLEVQHLVPSPKPSKKYIPESYKKIQTDKPKKIFFEGSKLTSNTIKQCMPFLDSLTNGYIQETWTDIYIEKQDEKTCKYIWSSNPEIMTNRNFINREIQEYFYPTEFTWRQPWKIKTPNRFSCLIVHPLNRDDLPFFTLSGIVDSDKYFHSSFGNIPFYIKKNFEGLIPAGTPMYQIIPIKRETWNSKNLIFDEKKQKILSNEILKKFLGAYKDNFWQKKYFN
jgi:hypothetical protein